MDTRTTALHSTCTGVGGIHCTRGCCNPGAHHAGRGARRRAARAQREMGRIARTRDNRAAFRDHDRNPS